MAIPVARPTDIQTDRQFFTYSVSIIITIGPNQISKHLGPDADVTVDVLAGYEFGVPRNGVIENFQFLIEPLPIFMISWMV